MDCLKNCSETSGRVERRSRALSTYIAEAESNPTYDNRDNTYKHTGRVKQFAARTARQCPDSSKILSIRFA